MEQRIAWDALPRPLKRSIEARTGPINDVRIANVGQNSPLAMIIDISEGKVFAKGLPSGHHRVITQAREAAVAPLVGGISPALLWHFDEARWNVLGYEYADGRHADYSPGSPDLDRLVQLMDTLSAIKVPDDAGPFKRAEDRWKPYLDDPETAAVFAGPALSRVAPSIVSRAEWVLAPSVDRHADRGHISSLKAGARSCGPLPAHSRRAPVTPTARWG